MEGTEMSPSVNSEENSVLDLPSICDPAELFVPPRSAENTEELYRSVDAFPSLPTENCNDLDRKLNAGSVCWKTKKRKGSRIKSKRFLHSRGSSVSTPYRRVLCCEGAEALQMACEKMKEIKEAGCQGESNLSSAVPAGFSDEGSEKANVRCYPKAGLCEPTEPDNAVLSWMYGWDSAENPSIRKSLDDFYKMYCKKQPGRMDPTYETASRCLSQKVLKLANRDGTKYAARCLQVAQLVLNRDGCKIFPNHPTSACFSKPAEGGVLLEDRKRTPGLSDDVLQFLLKQTRAEHSPDVSHEK